MKSLTILLFIALFVQINTPIILAQNEADTTFPTIENNPNINLDEIESSEPRRDQNKSNKKDKTVATWGENQSFFTNIIQGVVIFGVIIITWSLYQKWQKKERAKEEES